MTTGRLWPSPWWGIVSIAVGVFLQLTRGGSWGILLLVVGVVSLIAHRYMRRKLGP